MTDTLEAGLDRVYAAPRDSFVAERNALAKELRQAGATEESEMVAALRKPTLVAWGLNEIARSTPEKVNELLQSQERMQTAESAVGLREASDRRQTALGELTTGVVRILDEAGHAGANSRDKIELTLLALGTNPEAAELFRRARLTNEIEPGTSWSMALNSPQPRKGREEPTASDLRHLEKVRKEVQALRQRAEKQAERAEQANRRLEEARREAKKADRAATEAQAELDRKSSELHEAEREMEEESGTGDG